MNGFALSPELDAQLTEMAEGVIELAEAEGPERAAEVVRPWINEGEAARVLAVEFTVELLLWRMKQLAASQVN